MSRYEPRTSTLDKYTVAEVERWQKLMRDNKWSVNKLAKHLNKGYCTVSTYLDKYNAGQIT